MKMRAAVLRVPGVPGVPGEGGIPVDIEDVELEPPRAGEVLVRVEAAGVCHTELHYMAGEMTCPLPVVLGHEGAGIVEEVGPEVSDVAVGQRVGFTWRPRCGECTYCVTGRPAMCVYGKVQATSGGLMDGTVRLHKGDEDLHHFLGVSCFAEHAVVSRRAVVPLSAEVPAPIVAIAGCAVITGLGAILNVAAAQGAIAGRPAVVIGAGGVGLSAVMGACLLGSAPLVAVDVNPEKLELARVFGATDVVDASAIRPEEVAAVIRDLTHGGAEIALEAVGTPATLRQAFAALRPGGTVVAVGLGPARAEVPVPVNELVQQQKRLVGSLYGSSNPVVDLPRILELYQSGRLPLGQLLGATHPLEEVGRAYGELRSGAVGRAVIDPRATRA
ncbi:MAG TPA: zinc-binding dehydrogenase [Acidimicrobiales bacterium]|nr:zinc-binding dehydrogenase [Acidimicrobiales bacterium]